MSRLAIYILLTFTAVYMAFADGSAIWSGLYFVTNYSMLILLFLSNRGKWVRIIGVSLSASILIFSVLKFFISLGADILYYANAVTFIIIAVGLYKLESK